MATIYFEITIGTPPFTATIDQPIAPPLTGLGVGTHYFTGIPNGSYDITVTDSLGYSVSFPVGVNCTTTTTTTEQQMSDCDTVVEYSGEMGYGIESIINLGTGVGEVAFEVDPLQVPDRFIVYWDDDVVIDTGYRGYAGYGWAGEWRTQFNNSLTGQIDPITGNTYPFVDVSHAPDNYPHVDHSNGYYSFYFDKISETPNIATVMTYAPITGTFWRFIMRCPDNYGVPTTTTTTTVASTTTTEHETEICGYGLLYNWYAATDARKISSSDEWIVPSITQSETLATYVGGSSIAGGKLKETGFDYWNSPNLGATNEYGFSFRGNGIRTLDGVFTYIKDRGHYWHELGSFSDQGRISSMRFNVEPMSINFATFKVVGVAVRLVKESTTLSHGQTGEYIGNDGTVYQTICIGTQEWLAENLRETKYRNGEIIPEVTDNAEWASLTTGALCAYNNDWSNACMEKPDYSSTTTTTSTSTTTEEIDSSSTTTSTSTTEEATTFTQCLDCDLQFET